MNSTVSVVVPVYRSAATLRELTDRLRQALADAPAFEIIFVNDGSPDESWRAIEAIVAETPDVLAIDLQRNFGQQAALLCGIREARHDVILTIDDDLQSPPREIPKLIEALEAGADVVYGAPRTHDQAAWRSIGSAVVRLALRFSGGPPEVAQASSFRAFRRSAREAFAAYEGPTVSIDALLAWGTTRFAVVEVDHEPRGNGRSGYDLPKLLGHGIDIFTSFSRLPLRLASAVGFCFTLFGFGVLGLTLYRWSVYGSVVPGFAFLASSIAIFSGAQLFALGILGEYLGQIHARSMGRPSSSERRRIRSAAP